MQKELRLELCNDALHLKKIGTMYNGGKNRVNEKTIKKAYKIEK